MNYKTKGRPVFGDLESHRNCDILDILGKYQFGDSFPSFRRYFHPY